MKEKIVLLNSGGFDSVCLAHETKAKYPEAEVHSLFFDYGQKTVETERKCSMKVAEKLGFTPVGMCIPSFTWSHCALTDGSSDDPYINQRNLIFLSYAISYAESIGAHLILVAFIKPEDGTQYYSDTSPQFVERINTITNTLGIVVEAPFIHRDKYELFHIARYHGINRDDFISCSLSEEPCGECSDCKCIEDMYTNYIDPHVTEDIFLDTLEFTPEFIESAYEDKVTTAKVYVNDKCQFSCKHCFIGTKPKNLSEHLSLDEWDEFIKQLSEYGVEHIDFFGKEPLYDDRVFFLMDICRKFNITYTVVTNGVNIKKYIRELELFKPEVVLSVENLGKTQYRNSGKFIEDNIKLLLSRGVPVSITIDLSYSNFNGLKKLVSKLYKLGVKNIYVKPIRPFGEYEEELMNKVLKSIDLVYALDDLVDCASKFEDLEITYSLSQMDLQRMYKDCNAEFNDTVGYCLANRVPYYEGVILECELFCNRFRDAIAITPDGKMLGCASEYGCDDPEVTYDLRKISVEEAISAGKEQMRNNFYPNNTCVGCYFNKFYIETGKIFQ